VNLMDFDSLIRRSISSLLIDLKAGFKGKEREIVSLHVFGHLLPLCPASAIDPAQFGIEVGVPQHSKTPGSKVRVCKDFVIWPRPKLTCLESLNTYPAVITEWKVLHPWDGTSSVPRKRMEHLKDIEWMQGATERSRELTGYVVLLDQRSPALPTLRCTRVKNGIADPEWLSLPKPIRCFGRVGLEISNLATESTTTSH
jgi:hypothetical protein